MTPDDYLPRATERPWGRAGEAVVPGVQDDTSYEARLEQGTLPSHEIIKTIFRRIMGDIYIPGRDAKAS